MAPYHVVLVHFPIALWLAASLCIFVRSVNSGPLGQAVDRALPLFLVLGAIFGVAAYVVGLMVWPWETLSSTPMGRNHVLLASWSLGYFVLLAVTRLWQGERVWQGVSRFVMLALSGIGAVFVGITGTLGGHLVGNYTEVGQVLRLLGWEIYTTFYVPNYTLSVIVVATVLLAGLGLFPGRNKTAPTIP